MSVDHSVDPALFVDGEIAPARAVRRLTKGQPLPLGDARSLWIGHRGDLELRRLPRRRACGFSCAGRREPDQGSGVAGGRYRRRRLGPCTDMSNIFVDETHMNDGTGDGVGGPGRLGRRAQRPRRRC